MPEILTRQIVREHLVDGELVPAAKEREILLHNGLLHYLKEQRTAA